MLTEIEKFLAGKKTYGLVALGLLIVAAVRLDWIVLDPQLYQDLTTSVTLAAIAAMRAGVK